MNKFIFGVLVGIILSFLFLYSGGARYIKDFGARTQLAGEKLERASTEIKNSAVGARKAIGDTVGKTTDKVRELVQ